MTKPVKRFVQVSIGAEAILGESAEHFGPGRQESFADGYLVVLAEVTEADEIVEQHAVMTMNLMGLVQIAAAWLTGADITVIVKIIETLAGTKGIQL